MPANVGSVGGSIVESDRYAELEDLLSPGNAGTRAAPLEKNARTDIYKALCHHWLSLTEKQREDLATFTDPQAVDLLHRLLSVPASPSVVAQCNSNQQQQRGEGADDMDGVEVDDTTVRLHVVPGASSGTFAVDWRQHLVPLTNPRGYAVDPNLIKPDAGECARYNILRKKSPMLTRPATHAGALLLVMMRSESDGAFLQQRSRHASFGTSLTSTVWPLLDRRIRHSFLAKVSTSTSTTAPPPLNAAVCDVRRLRKSSRDNDSAAEIAAIGAWYQSLPSEARSPLLTVRVPPNLSGVTPTRGTILINRVPVLFVRTATDVATISVDGENFEALLAAAHTALQVPASARRTVGEGAESAANDVRSICAAFYANVKARWIEAKTAETDRAARELMDALEAQSATERKAQSVQNKHKPKVRRKDRRPSDDTTNDTPGVKPAPPAAVAPLPTSDTTTTPTPAQPVKKAAQRAKQAPPWMRLAEQHRRSSATPDSEDNGAHTKSEEGTHASTQIAGKTAHKTIALACGPVRKPSRALLDSVRDALRRCFAGRALCHDYRLAALMRPSGQVPAGLLARHPTVAAAFEWDGTLTRKEREAIVALAARTSNDASLFVSIDPVDGVTLVGPSRFSGLLAFVRRRGDGMLESVR